jgi:curli biogenesis system outer membrane secretion channel CsgG
MHSRLVGVVAAVIVASVLAAASTSPASAAKGCGRVAATRDHTTSHFRVEIARGAVSCEAARGVVKAYNSGKGTLHKAGTGRTTWYTTLRGGWTCSSGAGGEEACVRGPKINEYEHRDQVYATPV